MTEIKTPAKNPTPVVETTATIVAIGSTTMKDSVRLSINLKSPDGKFHLWTCDVDKDTQNGRIGRRELSSAFDDIPKTLGLDPAAYIFKFRSKFIGQTKEITLHEGGERTLAGGAIGHYQNVRFTPSKVDQTDEAVIALFGDDTGLAAPKPEPQPENKGKGKNKDKKSTSPIDYL